MHRKTLALVLCSCVVLLFVGLSPVAASATSVTPAIHEYVGRFTYRELVPRFIIYDPYGDGSYQYVSTSQMQTTTVSIFAGTGGGSATGQFTFTTTTTSSWTSSKSTNPSDMGPGKGDRIVGQVWDLTFDIWENMGTRDYYIYHLVSASYVSEICQSRSYIATNYPNTHIPDKTGIVGQYSVGENIAPNTEVTLGVQYSWSGTITVGFTFTIPLTGDQIGFTLSYSSTQTYQVTNYFYDSQNNLIFHVYADSATPNLSNVYSYTFWFGP